MVDDEDIKRIEEKVAMALKYKSWANAEDILRVEMPAVINFMKHCREDYF